MIVIKKLILSLGSNMGNKMGYLNDALVAIDSLINTRVLRVSSFYETEPVGFAQQDNFVNVNAEIETELSPSAFIGACLGIEASIGRHRTFYNAPRVIDIDLLLFEDYTSDTQELTLPHPRMHERGFVLVPLAELYPEKTALGFDFSAYLEKCDKSGVTLIRN